MPEKSSVSSAAIMACFIRIHARYATTNARLRRSCRAVLAVDVLYTETETLILIKKGIQRDER
jgi:hypothetical protein